MRIDFLGAVRNVTGSMHLLHVNGTRILLDCGLFQGHRQEAFERNRHLPFDASKVDVMVLSHAHIDHSGNIPNLVRSGFEGSIYTTFATRDLCSIMLRDSAYIMSSDIEYLNKKRRRRNQPPLEPIYTKADVVKALKYFVSINYQRTVMIAPGVRLTFYDAGHILGSAFTALDVEEDGRNYRLLFTGDVGRIDLPILRDPQVVSDVDYLITESTYGGRSHGTPEDAERKLARIVNETYEAGGKLIIPAFSVGRTQELVYALHRLTNADIVPSLPVFVDSPLAINATDVFRLHPECYDEETHEFMLKYDDPFGFDELRYTRQTSESIALNSRTDPIIIISASGMCEAGRILHHLKNNIEDPSTTVLFVGFQAQHTLGRRILEGKKRVPILGQEYTSRARIESIDGYSAHADQQGLLDYISKLGVDRLRRVFLVHGDPEACFALEKALHTIGVTETKVPKLGEKVHI